MFELPFDIEDQLQKKYPDVHIRSLIQSLFQLILNKTIEDGNCTIRGFGRFSCYKAYSSRTKKTVPRLKFKISSRLSSRMINDQYILSKLKVKNNIECDLDKFDEESIQVRDNNFSNKINSSSIGNKKANEAKITNTILTIINEE